MAKRRDEEAPTGGAFRDEAGERGEELLYCKLTREELVTRGAEAGTTREEIEAEERGFEDAKRAHKARLEALVHRERALLRELRSGETLRSVEIVVRVDWASGLVETVRSDTGEVFRSRPVSLEERQRKLAFDAKPRGAMAQAFGAARERDA